MKSLDELIEQHDPAMPLIKSLLDQAQRPYQLLLPSDDNDRVLLGLQITTRSTLGALAHETGGMLIDHGWLRILGSGNAQLPRNIVDWNGGTAEGHLRVADDAAGGFFSINGGGLGDDTGSIYYLAPDSLIWEPLDIGYTDFLSWALSDRIEIFYKGLRWDTWEKDVRDISAAHCVSFYPYLWTKEGSIETSSRRTIGIDECYELHTELSRQL
jgi:hypothetical protein